MNGWNLNNKKAVVTGGSKGIGKAIVKELLELGAEVLFTARRKSDLEAAHKEFDNLGFKAHILCGPIQDPVHQNQIREWVSHNWNALDILVNNAGINIRKPSHEYASDEYAQILNINLTAPFELSRLLFPLLKQNGKGAIINIASVAGSFDVQTGAPYGMSKAALLQLTRNLASEWAGVNIRVNSVSPWFTETPLTERLSSDAKKLSAIKARTPLERIAKDEEVAAAVAFLAMDKASFITGQNLSVDGGATISML